MLKFKWYYLLSYEERMPITSNKKEVNKYISSNFNSNK